MINVAIMGFGTVGSGVYEVIAGNNALLKQRLGDSIQVKKILDIRNFSGQEFGSKVVKNFQDIVEDPEIQIVVETMGGTDPAYRFVSECLQAGKHVVTSNKALVAEYGTGLLKMAREKGVNFFFEGSVGGGIPVIRAMSEAYSGEYIREITGILNGTTNFILTKMEEEGESFQGALKTAQSLGYAENNPAADVEGHDTCRKIAILASLATGKEVDFRDIRMEGISGIDQEDFLYAKALHSSIKLFGDARFEEGKLFAYVAPVMVSHDHPLYMVRDVFNGIMIEGNMLGKSMLYGSGAGKLPTASAMVADIIHAAGSLNTSICKGWSSEKQPVEDILQMSHSYFVRFKGQGGEAGERCHKAFGGGKYIHLEGREEFGFLTGLMREKDFLSVLKNQEGVLKYIRSKVAL